MFNDKPIINSVSCGCAKDISGNHLGQFDSRGNFTNFGSSFPSAHVDAFGSVRDNISGNVIGKFQGSLPMHQHRIHEYEPTLRDISTLRDVDYSSANRNILKPKIDISAFKPNPLPLPLPKLDTTTFIQNSYQYPEIKLDIPKYKPAPMPLLLPKLDTFKPIQDNCFLPEIKPVYTAYKPEPLPYNFQKEETYKPLLNNDFLQNINRGFPSYKTEPCHFLPKMRIFSIVKPRIKMKIWNWLKRIST
jgi:hypothetical protein